ncbi:MAG: dockerin type I repeat-containing protein, partial [Candidatus Avispirillum sp.]
MKKVLSSLLALLMLAGTLAVGISAQTFVNDDSFTVGNADASEDGNINGQDAYMIKSYLAGKTYALDNICFDAADMNADGVVNATDAYYLKCLLAGKMSVSDFDNGKQIYRLTVGGADISEFTLNVGDSAVWNDNSMYAAELMQRYVEQACGVRPQIVRGTPTGEHAIIFNIVDINSELGQQLGAEGYKY